MNQRRLRSIMRNINVLNVLLLVVILAAAAHIFRPLLGAKFSYTLPVPKKIAEGQEEKPAAAPLPSPMEYAVVAEQNVFNPERKIPPEKKADEKAAPKPEFVLYGTLLTGDTSIAFMEDLKAPYTTASRGKRQRTLKLGSLFSGYTLSQIFTDRVIMAKGEEKIEVRVMDSHKKAGATAAAVAPASPVQTPPGMISPRPPFPTKTPGAGLPPGVLKEGAPGQGPPSLPGGNAPAALPQVKNQLESIIKQNTGR